MRYLTLFTTVLAFGALMFVPARSADYEFSTSIQAKDIKISSITVNASDAIVKENVRWDARDIASLKKNLVKKVTSRLNRNNLMSDTGARLELTLTAITPNRPTMREMAKRSGLNFVSFGIGGAEVQARLVALDGTDLGQMKYRYFADYLYDYSSGVTTWFDARRSFDNFSRRLVKELITPGSS